MSPEIVATPFDINEVPENYLPESGYFFEANIDGDDIIREEATIKGQ
ncbi:hypothetical protein ACFP1I_30070 [Dyadobacter subterraneus]|uniref:Uncharacterized protein n=1 Tax=Dyadobacter subterraneus TaxID=2773304 RepID=A0ABR9WEQ3_9BACT|nr:hypothetical protein [Dyadobacter subterraneus]MBE9462816.1 hypothetical protein [Dyadobacter subterraneus]